jgi:hypothetical protein
MEKHQSLLLENAYLACVLLKIIISFISVGSQCNVLLGAYNAVKTAPIPYSVTFNGRKYSPTHQFDIGIQTED